MDPIKHRTIHWEKKPRRTGLKVGLGLAALGALSFAYPWHTPVVQDHVLREFGEFIVKMEGNDTLEQIDDLMEKYDITARKIINKDGDLGQYYVLDPGDKQDFYIEDVKKAVSEDWDVELVEDNMTFYLDDVSSKPNDKHYGELWGMQKIGLEKLHAFLNEKKADFKDNKVLVAIVDTGVDKEHEDLAGRFVDHKKYKKDGHGHGTHCAGTAAGISNNKVGVASYLPYTEGVDVTGFKVLSDYGSGTMEGIAQGIVDAADFASGAGYKRFVVSLSLGGYSPKTPKLMQQAIDYVYKKGGVVVAAAGNSADHAKNHTPANAKGVMVITATDSKDNLASFSSYCKDKDGLVCIAAPGVDILSTTPNDNYSVYSGTSMATPHVAGLVATMLYVNPDLSAQQLYDVMHENGAQVKSKQRTGNRIAADKSVIAAYELRK